MAKESRDVSAVLGGGHRVRSDDRFVSDERCTTDHPSAHSAELRDITAETVRRPLAPATVKRRVWLPILVARQERQLEPDAIPLIAGVTVLADFRTTHPRAVEKEPGQALAVIRPDGDVDVFVLPGHPA